MFFRPSFCANCGEKIVRADWGLLTSRRFCQVCESEYKGVDLIPRVIVVAGSLSILLGLSSYIGTGNQPQRVAARQLLKSDAPATVQTQVPERIERQVVTAPPPVTAGANVTPPPPTLSKTAHETERKVPDEPMYYCGAQTKKGTPCSRRVKGYVRCYQHTGMPAMLPADQLRIK